MSGAPPGYNANESMLEGGTAPIVSVMGGGASQALKNIRTKLSKKGRKRTTKHTRKRRQAGGLLGHYVLSSQTAYLGTNNSRLSITVVAQTPEEIKDFDDKKLPAYSSSSLADDIKNYADYSKRLWERADGSSAVRALVSNIMPMVAGSALGQVGSDRLGILLPNNIAKIFIFPPVRGNVATFKKYVSILFDTGNIIDASKPKTCLMFTGQFFGAVESVDSNTELFTYYMFIKNIINKSIHSIYVLTEYSVDTIRRSQDVTKNINPQPSDTTPIYPLLEPTYILLPYSSILQTGDSKDERGGILFSAATTDEVILPAPDSSMKGIIDVVLNSSIVKPLGVAYKPNVKKDDTKLGALHFREINVNTDIDTASVYTYSIGANPEYVKPASTVTGNSDVFVGNPKAVKNGIPLVPIQLGTQQFSIRASLPEVRDDWSNLVFTDEEANFITSLNISPTRLQSIFPNDWNEELASNLSVISRSKCFSDSRLVLHADCQKTQNFIAKIFKNFVENASEIVDFESAKVMNLTDEILQQTAALRSAGVISSPDIFDPVQFKKAFITAADTGNFQFIKDPDVVAKANLRAVPNYSQGLNQFSINILLINLNTTNKIKAIFTMDVISGITEKDMTAAYYRIIAKYNEIKNGIAKKFPAIRIILPE